MTNPDNALGTNGAFGGRTSVNALNDVTAVFDRSGIVRGWACVPSSGMVVALGGDGVNRDVAIAEDPVGNRTTINNISGAAVEVTIPAAPTVNSRIDAIVAYVSNPPQGSATEIDNPSAVGLIVVSGAVAVSPTAPAESAIRSAITADGASGSNAYYVILAYVVVRAGITTITASDITNGGMAGVVEANGSQSVSSSTIMSFSSKTTILTITATAKGRYFYSSATRAYSDSGADVLAQTSIEKNGTEVTISGSVNIGTNRRSYIPMSGIVSLDVGDRLTLNVLGEGGNVYNRSLTIVRIGS